MENAQQTLINAINCLKEANNQVRQNAENFYNQMMAQQPEMFLQTHIQLCTQADSKMRLVYLTYLHSSFNKKLGEVNENTITLFKLLSEKTQNDFIPQMLAIFQDEKDMKTMKMLAEVITNAICGLDNRGNFNVMTILNTFMQCIQSPSDGLRYIGYNAINTIEILIEDQAFFGNIAQFAKLASDAMGDKCPTVCFQGIENFILIVQLAEEAFPEQYKTQLIALMKQVCAVFQQVLGSSNLELLKEIVEIISEFVTFPQYLLRESYGVFVSGLINICGIDNLDVEVRASAMNAILEIVTPLKFFVKREGQSVNQIMMILLKWLCQTTQQGMKEWETSDEFEEEDIVERAIEMIDKATELFGGETMYKFIVTFQASNFEQQLAVIRWVYISLNSGKHFYKNKFQELLGLAQNGMASQVGRIRYMACLLVTEMVSLFEKKLKAHCQTILTFITNSLADPVQKVNEIGCDLMANLVDYEMIPMDVFANAFVGLTTKMMSFVQGNYDNKLKTSSLATINFMIHYMKGKFTPETFTFCFDFFKGFSGALSVELNKPLDEKSRKNMLKLKSRCIEGLSMLVYACQEGVDKQSAMIMFNDIMTVFQLPDNEKDIVMPFAEKALTRLAGLIKEEMKQYMQIIVPVIVQRAARAPAMAFGQDADNIENMNDEDWLTSYVAGLNLGIKTSEIEEKADAISTLDLFFDDLGEIMYPYIDHMMPLLTGINFIFDDEVRTKTTTFFGTLFKAKMVSLGINEQNRQALGQFKQTEFYQKIMETFVKTITIETDSSVAVHKINVFRRMIEALGPNALTQQEITLIFQCIAEMFKQYKETTESKQKVAGNIRDMTDEEKAMIDSQNETESDAIMQCQHLFQEVIRLNEHYRESFQQTLLQPLMQYYQSGNHDFVSTAIVYIGDLLTHGKCVDMFAQVFPNLIQCMLVQDSDTQYNACLTIAEILKFYSSQQIQPFAQQLWQAILTNAQLAQKPEKKDIYEANLITMGSILFSHNQLLQAAGIDVAATKMTWLSQIINVENVADQALILMINLVHENKLDIPTKDVLASYISFIGNTLVDVGVDEELRVKLVQVLGMLNNKFGQQVVNEVWATLTLEARAEFKDILAPPKN